MQKENNPTASNSAFIVNRIFNAPRDLVFRAHTESSRLCQWWGPKGYAMNVAKLDLSPGGLFHYSMRSPEGHEMWGRFCYREIVNPERIVFVNSFADDQGDIVRAPFAHDWPLEILNIMTLSEKDGKTTLTLKGSPINATAAEIRRFESFNDAMRQGFGATLDQLEAYLVTAG